MQQRGRFAQEFLAELMREPRALRVSLLTERAKWLRSLKVGAREDLLFELELILRSLELTFDRREQAADGRALLGQDFTDELRAVRDALHRFSMVARRLTPAPVEQNYQFRAYLERQGSDDQKRTRLTHDLAEQRTPDDGLLLLRHSLRALQGLSDQLLKQPQVTFQAFSDFAILGEQIIVSSRFFRPPSVLEFRAEYDRVGSVRLLELVKRVSEPRARKALALGFLACFRLLRYLRHVPPMPTPAPRRSLLTMLLVRDEAASVANYLSTDLPRLAATADESGLITAAAGNAADELRNAISLVTAKLSTRPVERESLEIAREALSEGAKKAASALAQAVEPGSKAAEIFDGQRARRERAERLRRDLWVLGQQLRAALEALFPAVRGEHATALEPLARLLRFIGEFRGVGYHLLRAGDHEPFDRFFQSVDALTHTASSPARDRHLYLECRRFLPIVERALALVSRRAELVDAPADLAAFEAELARFGDGNLLGTRARLPEPPPAPAEPLPPLTNAEEEAAAALAFEEPLPPAEDWGEPLDEGDFSEAEAALASEPGALMEPDFTDDGDVELPAFSELTPPPPPDPTLTPPAEQDLGPTELTAVSEEDEAFDPDMTRRIFKSH